VKAGCDHALIEGYAQHSLDSQPAQSLRMLLRHSITTSAPPGTVHSQLDDRWNTILNKDLEFFSRQTTICSRRKDTDPGKLLAQRRPWTYPGLKNETAKTGKKMTKLLMVTAAILTLNIATANANDYLADQRAPGINSGVEQTHVYNRSSGWRHERQYRQVPWYAYSESGNCFVWTPDAYHYECDPNAHY
jgi:hypothetical protein